jgi:hypothetical protein
MFTEYARDQLQQVLDDMVDDTVVFKLHDGPPGPDFTHNLMFGDGLPQEYAYSQGGEVVFEMPRFHDRHPVVRRWWQRRRQVERPYEIPMLEIHYVSLWSRGAPLVLADGIWFPYRLSHGDRFILSGIGRPTIR